MQATPRPGASIAKGCLSLLRLPDLFAAQAVKNPDAAAVVCGQEQLTYAELDARSNQLARHLQRLGVGPESLVALHMSRSPRVLVSILGILKAGGAYLPIDPEYPADRSRFLIEDAKPRVILTEESLEGALPLASGSAVLCLDSASGKLVSQESRELPPSAAQEDSAAYVIYTSGSTGTPKGVVVTHQNVVRLFQSTAHWYQFSSEDVWTQFHSFAFDFSVWEIWGALLYGGKLVVVPYMVSRSPEAFHDLLVREGVTVLSQTPSAFRQLDQFDRHSPRSHDLQLRWVIFGGEALELQTLKPWFDRHGDEKPRLVNMYGITETTVHVTYRPIRHLDVLEGKGSVIGEPIPDLSLHILDEHQRPCPAGVAGEIYVGGAGVARGYLRRPELDRERFLSDLPAVGAGLRLYRSGDLARRFPDGEVEYLGRIDHQVKIRGFRIELGEIEATLSAHPTVRECVVLARKDLDQEPRLVAYLVSPAGKRPNLEELRGFLRHRLPEYMVPARFVYLDRFPLTLNHKIDRQALPAPERTRPEMGNEFTPPLTSEEKILASIWESVLQVEPVGVHDNFFALGGDSIKSIQILARAQAAGMEISLPQLFAEPTVYQLVRSKIAPEEKTLPTGTAPFSQIPDGDRAQLPDEIVDAYPMAQLQTGMLFYTQRDPESSIFHDVFSFRFEMQFDQDKLSEAVEKLARRHPIYRTSFDLGAYSQPLQLVWKSASVSLTFEDLRDCGEAQQQSALRDWVEREKRRPFDWHQPPLMRLHIQRYREQSFQLIVSFHHVIMDGWSLAAMLTELFQHYSALLDGRGSEPLPPAIAYRDFIALEQKAIRSYADRNYWRRKLENATIQPLPRWPATLRQGGREQVRGPEIVFRPELLRQLKELAISSGVPLRTVLLAAHLRVLSVVTGQDDIMTGLVSNGRPQIVGGENVIGLFLNTLPFRQVLKGGTWRGLVKETFETERELIPHRRLPLAQIQQLTGGQALFETVFDFVQFHVYQGLPGHGAHCFLEDHYFEANNFTFYATFMLDAEGAQLQMHFDYDPNELCPPQIHALCEYYRESLMAMAHSPDSPYQLLSLLPPIERDRVLVEWNKTERPVPELTVDELIRAQAYATPDSVAVVHRRQSLTYRELEQRTSALAAQLREMGVGPEVLVGIQLPRSLDLVVSLLAIWKAGGAYVPLDPNYPQARLQFMKEDAQLKLVLTGDTGLSNRPCAAAKVRRKDFANGQAVSSIETAPSPAASSNADHRDRLAYVIYTSGSTGQPKGVQITHRSLTNFLCSMREAPGLDRSDTLLAVTTLSFDIAALELFLPLVVGARLVIADAETSQDPDALASALQEHRATVLQATPTTWQLLVESRWKGDKTLKALCGGEGMSRQLADLLLQHCGEVWNMYGPTETTVWSCVERVERGIDPIPIGRPIANTQAWVLNAARQPVPIGTEGELFLGGIGLARGYLNSPELTAERFIPNPFRQGSGERLYRTGDLARYLPDGRIVCGGRTDFQVKVRGVRIQLGEIESTSVRHEAVESAVAVAKDAPTGKRLVLYYRLREGAACSMRDLRSHLESRLPSQMVPSAFVEVTEWPRTPNGKLDRARLPEPPSARPELATAYVAPRTPIEEAVAELWKESLNVERVGLHDSFFELGGHSLTAIQLIARLRHELQAELNLATLFEHPRLEDFAFQVLDNLLSRAANSPDESPTLPNAAPMRRGETGHFQTAKNV
jgi:amino acid adenylation domain-containing protein